MSLLESMACGVYPIATDTGFSRDIIVPDYGKIINPFLSIENVVKLIKEKYYQTYLSSHPLDWLMNFSYSHGSSRLIYNI